MKRFFADDLIMLTSSVQGFEHALDLISTACVSVEMKISTERSQVLYYFSTEIEKPVPSASKEQYTATGVEKSLG